VDEDGDVDHEDFSAFQLCFTGNIGGLPEGCGRFDRQGDGGNMTPDGDVDSFDREAFEACASGPGVPADVCCDGQPKPGCPVP